MRFTINQDDWVFNFWLIHEMVLDEVLVDETAKQRALVPANNQMINVEVTEVLQVVRNQMVAHFKW